MGLLYLDTADTQTLTRWTGTTNASVSTDTARTGSRSFKLSGNTGALYKSVGGTSATMYAKCGDYFNTAVDDLYKVLFQEGSTTHLAIRFNSLAGTIAAYRGDSNLLGSAAVAGITNGVWYGIEMKVVVNDSTGIVQVKVNGNLVLDLSSQDTRNGGSGYVDRVNWYHSSGSSRIRYVDDIVIRDDAWPGLGGVYVLVPNATGDTASWTPSAGNDYECVDELPASFTDYLSTDAATLNTIHLLNVASLSVTPETISGVAVCAYAKLSTAGSGNVRAKAKSGSTTVNGSSVGLDTTGVWCEYHMSVNPDDSAAWENADIAALQIGAETI